MRDQPPTRIMASAASPAPMPTRRSVLLLGPVWVTGSEEISSCMAGLHFHGTGFVAAVPVDEAENGGHEEEGSDGRADQAADDRAAERRVLLAAVPETERHRRHADDHR